MLTAQQAYAKAFQAKKRKCQKFLPKDKMALIQMAIEQNSALGETCAYVKVNADDKTDDMWDYDIIRSYLTLLGYSVRVDKCSSEENKVQLSIYWGRESD